MKPFSMPELPPVLADMQRRITEFVGSHATTDLQGPLRQALESALQRMDLVTREEFAQQQRLLALAEEKIAALEAMLAQEAEARSGERSGRS
jgi:BMFP domain-containing protein YqiC